MGFEWRKRPSSRGSLVPSDWGDKDFFLGMADKTYFLKSRSFILLPLLALTSSRLPKVEILGTYCTSGKRFGKTQGQLCHAALNHCLPGPKSGLDVATCCRV